MRARACICTFTYHICILRIYTCCKISAEIPEGERHNANTHSSLWISFEFLLPFRWAFFYPPFLYILYIYKARVGFTYAVPVALWLLLMLVACCEKRQFSNLIFKLEDERHKIAALDQDELMADESKLTWDLMARPLGDCCSIFFLTRLCTNWVLQCLSRSAICIAISPRTACSTVRGYPKRWLAVLYLIGSGMFALGVLSSLNLCRYVKNPSAENPFRRRRAYFSCLRICRHVIMRYKAAPVHAFKTGTSAAGVQTAPLPSFLARRRLASSSIIRTVRTVVIE